MEIANFIVSVFGFGILGWIIYGMNKRVDTQKGMLDEQGKMLDFISRFKDIFGTEDYLKNMEAYKTIIETNLRDEVKKDLQLKDTEFSEFKKRASINIETLSKGFEEMTGLFWRTIYYVSPQDRVEIFKYSESEIAKIMKDEVIGLPYIGDMRIKAIQNVFCSSPSASIAAHKATIKAAQLDSKENKES